jgi:ketosteroid isomerase-like protein
VSAGDPEIVRGFFDALGSVGTDSSDVALSDFERRLDPQAEYVEDPSWPGADVYRGRDEVRRAFEQYGEVLRLSSLRVEDVIAAGDQLVALVRIAGESEEGLPFENRWGYVCQVRGGLILRFQAYLDARAALEAAGVKT